MERISTLPLGFGKVIAHLLPGLVMISSIFMAIEILSTKNLTIKMIESTSLIITFFSILIISGLILGLIMDQFFHHLILQNKFYNKQRFFKEYKGRKIKKLLSELSVDEKNYYYDDDGFRISDYYYLPLIGPETRNHALEGGIYYEEFFSNMFFSMIFFTIIFPIYIYEIFKNYNIFYGNDLTIFSIATFILFIFITVYCLIEGYFLSIESRKRKIELIKGAIKFKSPSNLKKHRKTMNARTN